MQQTFTKEFIEERIRDTQFPLWSLALCQGFKNTANIMQYYGSDFEDEDTADTKIEKSIAALNNTLSTFPPDSEFIIEIKASRQANGSGVVGPFHFTNAEPEEEEEETTDTNTATPALGAPPAGYVPESMLKGLQDSLQKDFNMQLENMRAEMERERQEEDYQRRMDALDARERELKEQEKEYNSSVAKAADVLIAIGKKFGAAFLMPGMQTAPATDLGSTPDGNDPKAAAVDDFAAFLYQNFSTDDIIKLKQNIANYGKSNMAKQSAADTDGE